MQFRLLGLLEVISTDGKAIPIAPGKESALLAVLLLHANEPVSLDRFADELWDNERPAKIAKTLQVYVSRLRKRLGAERLLTTPGGYLIHLDPVELDVEMFELFAKEGAQALERRALQDAVRLLSDALALWRGPPLANFGFDPFAQDEIRRLNELHDAVIADRVDGRLALGEAERLLPELESLARARPLNERLQGQLMLCLYRCRRQADALEVYSATRGALVDELGIEPDRRLRELHQAILRQDAELDTSAVPRLLVVDPRRPFVGRERELAELESRLDDAMSGRGSLALIVGEPGIGKSRLAEELAVRARARGVSVLVGRCWEAGGAPAYWPWVQSLRTHVLQTEPSELREQLGNGASEIAQILPELREMFPDLPEPGPAESESARFRLFDALSRFLRRASESKPIVLGLDDLHAADASSLLLLEFVVRELPTTRLFVLGAYRDVDPTPAAPLTALLAALSREPAVLRLQLQGLDKTAISEYVEWTDAELASSELAEALTEKTEGNPLFVGEIVRLLGTERASAGTTAPQTIAIPQSIRGVITQRLARLSEECTRVLPLAAVLGREFAIDVLACMSDTDEDCLLDVLGEAIEARVVADIPGTVGRLRFAHVLIRDTLYEELTGARRVRLHRQTVEALETIHGDATGPYLSELALHALAGNDPNSALTYSRQAGDRAFALIAYEEAAQLYESALRALDTARPDDDVARCELLLALGDALSRAGDDPAAKDTFLAAASIAERLGLEREFARAAMGYGGRMLVVRAGRDDRLVPLLEKALQMLPDDEIELRGRLLGRLAGALRGQPDRERRELLSRQAIELARRAGNDVALAFALDGRASAIVAPDTIQECLALGEELCTVGERIGDRERLVQGCSYRLMTQLMLGDLEHALCALEHERRAARDLGQPAQLWGLAADEAMLALMAGRFENAASFSERAFNHGQQAIPELAIPVYTFQRYLLHYHLGGLDRIEPTMRKIVAAHPSRPMFAFALAHIHAITGRQPEAERVLDELADSGLSTVPFDQEWLVAMSLLAETATLLERRDISPALYELILPFSALNSVDLPEGIRGSMSRYLGLLATLLQRWDAAEKHFDEALTLNERIGATPWLALSRSDYARMLLARNTPGDRQRAQQLLADASTAYGELGVAGHQ